MNIPRELCDCPCHNITTLVVYRFGCCFCGHYPGVFTEGEVRTAFRQKQEIESEKGLTE